MSNDLKPMKESPLYFGIDFGRDGATCTEMALRPLPGGGFEVIEERTWKHELELKANPDG